MSLEQNVSQHVMARFDAPAFIRRAQSAEMAWQSIVELCRTRYEDYLQIPKLRLGTLVALAGDSARVTGALSDAAGADELERLQNLWRPRLRVPVPRATSPEALEEPLRRVISSFERFNRRWLKFVEQLSLTEVNRLRQGYNCFYLLEKECALRSPAIAREGFAPLPPARCTDLFHLFPLFSVPRLRG